MAPRRAALLGVTEELGTEIHVIFTIDAPPVEHAALASAAETIVVIISSWIPVAAG